MKSIHLAHALACGVCCLSAVPAEARFLQVDPVGYEDYINLYIYTGNDPLNRMDPTGKRDIYIGGAADKNMTRIVQDYATRQAGMHPDRDIQYFSYGEWKQVINAASEPLAAGEPLNIIGHSLGGRNSLAIADARSEISIDNLITIDPVGAAGTGSKPGNVENWTNVNAVPGDRNSSDTIASIGRAAYGTTNTGGADANVQSNANHGDFGKMMQDANALKKIEDSYKGLRK